MGVYISQRGNSPLYIGIVWVGQHRSHTFGNSTFPWRYMYALNPESVSTERYIPMVKIWGSSKNEQNWTIGKLQKFIFTILHLVVAVVTFSFNSRISKTGLN